jgi:hypothetical protein
VEKDFFLDFIWVKDFSLKRITISFIRGYGASLEPDPRAMVKKGPNSNISGFNNNSKMKQLNLDQFIKK